MSGLILRPKSKQLYSSKQGTAYYQRTLTTNYCSWSTVLDQQDTHSSLLSPHQNFKMLNPDRYRVQTDQNREALELHNHGLFDSDMRNQMI